MDQPKSTSTPESLALRLSAMINSNWITQALYVAAHYASAQGAAGPAAGRREKVL